MAVLSDADIKKIIKDDDGIIIANGYEKNITAVGYDLTIGVIYDCDSEKEPEPEKGNEIEWQKKIGENGNLNGVSKLSKNTTRYEILPGHRYLVISKEYIALPSSYMATLHSRGSYALKGIIVLSTVIDPHYKGFIYSMLYNCSQNSVYIKEGNQFATMVIHQFLTPTETELQVDDEGRYKAVQQTLNGYFSNIKSVTSTKAKLYDLDTGYKIKGDVDKKEKRIIEKDIKRQQAKKEEEEEEAKEREAKEKDLNEMRSRIKRLEDKNKKDLIFFVSIAIVVIILCYSIWGMSIQSVAAGMLSVIGAIYWGFGELVNIIKGCTSIREFLNNLNKKDH